MLVPVAIGAKALEPRANVRGWTRRWTLQFKDAEYAPPLYEGLIKAGLE